MLLLMKQNLSNHKLLAASLAIVAVLATILASASSFKLTTHEQKLDIPDSNTVESIEVWLYDGPFDFPEVKGKPLPAPRWKEIREYFDNNAVTRHRPRQADKVGAIRITTKTDRTVTLTYYSAGKEGLVFSADGESFYVASCGSGECSYKLAVLILSLLQKR